jgi:NADH-quinone oxidoreductase subunit L
MVSWGDRNIVDGGVKLTVFTIKSAGQGVRGLQNGKIQSYYLVTALGVVLLVLWLMIL